MSSTEMAVYRLAAGRDCKRLPIKESPNPAEIYFRSLATPDIRTLEIVLSGGQGLLLAVGNILLANTHNNAYYIVQMMFNRNR